MHRASALLTDLYQLTMLQSYLEHDLNQTAVFEFFVRKLPSERNFLVAAGLEQVLQYLESLQLSPEELQWLEDSGRFSRALIDYLANLRFTGDVHAMSEGTVFFADEPILRITAPLPLAQLLETRIINLLHFQTLIASKAARMVLAAPDRLLVDFGLRRAHGEEAGLLAARAAYLAGMTGTATVQAAPCFGIPIFGTMAHSYVLAHDDEYTAFEHFARSYPQGSTLLIDTYDTEAAAAKVVRLAQALAPEGISIRAVRLDSGDLHAHAVRVRKILDDGGCGEIKIFASGNLDEYVLAELLAKGAPIDGFGVGTRLDTSADVPYLDCAYKLQEYAGIARRKLSEGKATWPGRKQVYRRYDEAGRLCGDVLTTADDVQDGTALLQAVMQSGRRTGPPLTLDESRAHCARQLNALPPALRRLDPHPPFPVTVSPALHALASAVDQRLRY
ncbi:MAG: nicotinate phosphoribosyltransferase [Pseudomonadota bacterium]